MKEYEFDPFKEYPCHTCGSINALFDVNTGKIYCIDCLKRLLWYQGMFIWRDKNEGKHQFKIAKPFGYLFKWIPNKIWRYLKYRYTEQFIPILPK